MAKLTLKEFVGLFPNYESHKFVPLVATKRGYAHKHNPHYMPPKSKMTPKIWEEQERKRKKQFKLNTQKTLKYKCPVCEIPMRKLGYCEMDKKWSVFAEDTK